MPQVEARRTPLGLESTMSEYKPNMTEEERTQRVLRQICSNANRSRQSWAEWAEVYDAYVRFLQANHRMPSDCPQIPYSARRKP